MWKEYSISYLKKNKITSISIMIAALISAMFLSLITTLFYNIWVDNINRIIKEEGDWQAKITGSLSEKERESIQGVANVEAVVISQTEAGMETLVYFYEMRSIYEDMPEIIKLIGVDEEYVQYHNMLLSQYFIFDPEDERPPMLLAFYVFVMAVAGISLMLVIRNAFLISMQSRLHQFGILQSIGATPRQIRICLLQEALGLCLLPIFTGIAGGVSLCYGVIQLANEITADYHGEKAVFSYQMELFIIAFLASIFTVLYSAWISARKFSKMSLLEIIRGGEEQEDVRKLKKFRFISFCFGIEGELARKSLYVRRKALRTATLSLTLSYLAFSVFLCFMTLSGISTKYTYFERYKDVWDIMVTVKDQKINDMEALLDEAAIDKIESYYIYQKVLTYTWLTEDMLSDELKALGGFLAVAGTDVSMEADRYQVTVPIIIMEDRSFQNYCERIGVNVSALNQGMVCVNRIWDNIHSNFRGKQYIPFIKERVNKALPLFQTNNERKVMTEIPVLAYTNQLPELREELANYALVQIMSASTWQGMATNMRVEEPETYINVQTAADKDNNSVLAEVVRVLGGKDYEIENRLEQEQFNTEIKKGYTLIVGGLCGLLAIIGLANVFTNTLGYIYQRKREFARYLSIGLTPQGIKKILGMEVLIIGGRPIVFTIPLTIVFVVFAASASYIDLAEFLKNMPIVPLIIFACIIFGSVALAYYVGGRRLLRVNIIEALKNDTLS
ncbi:MAG: ABC-type transport system, involved in lipoprotein release, permease component [Herbinix sp.]|jgi:putative ABC transport system permease protein|nr:ABC-type transport system, involved in lipoprotein release, permease component [Herbinix sp.]